MKLLCILTISAFLQFLIHQAHAQTDIFPGYAVRTTGDTLRGFIRFSGRPSPRTVGFRPTPDATEARYSPAELQAFSIRQADSAPLFFVAYSGPVEGSPRRLDQLNSQPGPVFESQSVFLERLIQGRVSLYLLIDKTDQSHYFVQKGQETPTELITKRYRVDEQTMQQNTAFRNQLYGLLSDDERFTERTLSQINYEEADLSAVIAQYNGIVQTKATTNRRRITLTVELKAGGRYGNVSSKGAYARYPFPSATNVTGGVALKATLPRTNGRLSLYNELLYEQYSTSATVIKDENNRDGYAISLRYLKLFTLIRKEFGSGSVHPFVNAGISNAFALQNTITQSRTFYSTTTTSAVNSLAEIARRHELGVTAGGGVYRNRISAELRYELTNGFVNALDVSTSRQNIWLLVGYRL